MLDDDWELDDWEEDAFDEDVWDHSQTDLEDPAEAIDGEPLEDPDFEVAAPWGGVAPAIGGHELPEGGISVADRLSRTAEREGWRFRGSAQNGDCRVGQRLPRLASG